ncbi:tetratricopeptide repeat protein [Desulfurivibrio alkaliphilus]|uniref:Tetratricopeptide TPR_2 repeat protein n=1 Tax=Desulfurivibrio alkaliphilus (strain DSM 19089 / UNIQEM U267 / AHT2) TaxID=589865 RepID=D6Z1P8_DESAT|nr:tetratricopeptide repeat protein [Desulfurivibrio alkaliphilus]ADH85473.1 Tetratricopeptide TPR_2 repeat protein [Desulfurivibrio alkaliphilus AHT 2]
MLYLLTLFGLLLGGCTFTGNNAQPFAEAPTANVVCPPRELPSETVIHLDLIAEMQQQGLYHAALAHLDALEADLGEPPPRALYLRAEALRHSGQPEAAEVLYLDLTTSCLAARGYRGLGRLAMAAGRQEEGVSHLRRAVALQPTDARFRNDLGYALLLAGQPAEALPQLRTAVELGGGERALVNQLLALLVLGRFGEAEMVADNAGLPRPALEQLRAAAAKLEAHDDR